MKKRLIISTLMVLFVGTIALAQNNWRFSKNIYTRPETAAQATHGVAVSPDGCIWINIYRGGTFSETGLVNGGVLVYNPDGTEKAKINEVSIDGVMTGINTISGAGRGMSASPSGNVITSNYDTWFEFDYQTLQLVRMAVSVVTPTPALDEIITSACADEFNNVVVSALYSSANGVMIYNDEGGYLSMAIAGGTTNLPSVSRDIALSPDGLDLYVAGNNVGHWHSDDATFGSYTFVKFIGNYGGSSEDVHLDQYGKLWIGVNEGSDPSRYDCWDLSTNPPTIVDVITSPAVTGALNNNISADMWNIGAFATPRGFWLSPDGKKVYIGDYVNGIQEFENMGPSDAKEPQAVPEGFALSQNYPNPFNPSTNFTYSLPNKADVRIAIYDLFGREINTLVNESKEAGTYTITWNGRDNQNRQVSTGVYFYKMQAAGFEKTMKMMLVK